MLRKKKDGSTIADSNCAPFPLCQKVLFRFYRRKHCCLARMDPVFIDYGSRFYTEYQKTIMVPDSFETLRSSPSKRARCKAHTATATPKLNLDLGLYYDDDHTLWVTLFVTLELNLARYDPVLIMIWMDDVLPVL